MTTSRRRSYVYLEALEQRLFIRRLRTDPRTRDVLGCAVPNGGRRSQLEAIRLKAEGVTRGVPDWLCFERGATDTAVGLAIEFKSPTGRGRITPEQRVWHLRLTDRGWRVAVVTSAQEAWNILCHHLGITGDVNDRR